MAIIFQPWHIALAVFFMILFFLSWWVIERKKSSSKTAAYIRGEIGEEITEKQSIFRRLINLMLVISAPILPKQQELEKWELILYRANMDYLKPEELYVIRLACGVIMGAVMSLIFMPHYIWMLLAGVFNGFMWYLLPASFVSSKAKVRQAKAQEEVFNYVNMLEKICKAGLDIKAGIRSAAKNMPGVLSQEFEKAFDQMRHKRFKEAMEDLKKRLEIKDVDLLVDALLQSERGANVVVILRDQAERIRKSNWERHAQAAQKAPLKMLIPLFIFVFPPLGVFMVGPMAIELAAAFKI